MLAPWPGDLRLSQLSGEATVISTPWSLHCTVVSTLQFLAEPLKAVLAYADTFGVKDYTYTGAKVVRHDG
jgi:hypothetical protein